MSNTTASPAHRRILLVEDDKALAHTLTLKLQSQGYHVTLASNGRACLDYVTRSSFDVVLLDMVMPEADGFWVLEQMAQLAKRPKVIALSSLSQEEDERRALALGATKYFVKSDMQLDDILDAVDRVDKG